MTVPGPFTMSQQAQNDYYPSEEAAAMDYAVAVNEEIRDLVTAGADVVQVDARRGVRQDAGDGGRGADAAFGAWYPVSAPPEGVASRQAYVQPGPARPTPRETR